MALKSINEANYDEATTFDRVEEEVQGQPQTTRDPDDGKVTIRETRFVGDTQIVDPNHPLAVQVLPEGSTVGVEPALAAAWNEGTPEEQFGGKSEPKEVTPTVPAGPGTDKNAGRAKKSE
jgi:FKBP-type peptidyl-prolyl cis-trans isomerase 2